MTATLTGRGVLIWLTGFFAVIFATNLFFIVLSYKTFRGEDEQKPYLQGIEYNDTLARRALQARLGWHATIGATRLPSGHVRIDVALRDAAGNPRSAPLTAALHHPSDENRDEVLSIVALGDGQYMADAGALRSGWWDVVVKDGSGHTPFEAARRLWVP